jgi:hypothetical protein
MSELYYLQDSRSYTGDCLTFWGLGGSGYYSGLAQCHQYTKDQALCQHHSRGTDIPWPVDYIDERSFLAVDCQHMKPEMREGLTPDSRVYVHASGDWNGNDVYWLGSEGRTLDLKRAKALTLAEAQATFGHCPEFLFWPAGFIEGIARMVVHRQSVNIKDALRGTGIKLTKPEKPKKQRYRCEPCGRFIKQEDFYSGCPNCGAHY